MNRRQVLLAEVPEGFLREVLSRLIRCYQIAPEIIEKFLEGEAESSDVLPFVRRALIEEELARLARKWKLKGDAHPSGGFWHHRRVEAGRVIITQNTATDENAPVRVSDYKVRYSKGLFPADEIEAAFGAADVADGQTVYALLTHGRAKGAADRLGFAQLRFPKEGCDDFWPEEIDLFKLFPDLVSTGIVVAATADVEVIADEAIPELNLEGGVGS